ncbi:ABC transporter permease [Sediminispirochaeta smaragdinae]|uniref:Binding-protein-dependent transport systems inner membrane component n=1 Tax=Sediminispirochaeta smaragdinae (strain DSM 11293 / JCM 15392 / SEBR 4228) TaxID=573413 RepID=E1R136_SEDSS|nr:ABC transporter permease [Sediminispirochaeta smaragdinae]ADK80285.1 binding-protein-dependent transport systems inner membrane component [Sediminispirochaeta smaragdinae DSM 11293]
MLRAPSFEGSVRMRSYILRRLLLFIPVLIGISIAVFLLMHLIPGNAVDSLLGVEATDELRAQLTKQFGLDLPWYRQYANWITGVVQGDFGNSIRTGKPILPEILERFKVTFELSLIASLISWIIAIPLGILAAVKRNTLLDGVARVVALFWVSIPNFALATLLLLFLSLKMNYYPALKYASFFSNPVENLQIMFFPALVLGAIMAGSVMRMTRSSVLEVLRQDFIRTIRAKGAKERVVIFKHALKNSFSPIITIVGMQMGYLLGGTVVTEQIFSLPGLGLFILTGINQRDYPVVQGSILFFALIFGVINLLVDLIYAGVDPRIQYK